MLRVMHVIPSLGAGGGAEQVLLQLLPSLRTAGVAVEVACLWAPDDLRSELQSRGIEVRSLGYRYADRWNPGRVALHLAREIQRFRPEIIHSHLFFGVLHGALAPSLGRSVRVSTLHNMDYEIYPARTPTERIRRELHRRALWRSSGFICVSESVRTHYQTEFALENTCVIPNAIADELFQACDTAPIETRQQLGIPDHDALIVLPGRLVKQKGHRDALRALKSVLASGCSARLALPGRGPLRSELENLAAELGLANQVHFLDVLPHAQFVRLLSAADLVIMPSHQEGFGIVAAEAMAAAKALIASDIGPLRELIEPARTGLLVPPSSPMDLAKAIQKLLHAPEDRRALGVAARETIRDRFGSAQVAQRTTQFYDACLSRVESSRTRWVPKMRRAWK